MKTLKFRNGDELPMIGLGTWKSAKGEVGKAVKAAIDCGYKHVDCAATYRNEAEVGNAVSDILQKGKVQRKDLWITSKLWNNAHKKNDVIPALKQTLHDLKLDYLDLYLIHWPVAFKPEISFPKKDDDYLSLDEAPIIETWNEFLEAKKQGLIKHAGVSNFSIPNLKDLISKTNDIPEMNQVELHPYLQQNELINFCKHQNIFLTGYSPLGSGDRPEELKAANEPSLLENEVIKEIAETHNATPGQVLIKWHLERGNAVIPKSTHPGRIQENLKSVEINLDNEDLRKIKELDRHFRYVTGEFFVTPGNPYEDIYDDKN